MLARTHVAIGALSALLAIPILRFDDTLLFVGMSLFASLLPDIDHHGSSMNRLFVITKIIPKFVRHRGICHSIWPLLIGGAALYNFGNPIIAWGFLVGYGSHLISDCFTKDGINFLHPLMQFKIAGPVRTGTWMESLTFLATLGGIAGRLLGAF